MAALHWLLRPPAASPVLGRASFAQHLTNSFMRPVLCHSTLETDTETHRRRWSVQGRMVFELPKATGPPEGMNGSKVS